MFSLNHQSLIDAVNDCPDHGQRDLFISMDISVEGHFLNQKHIFEIWMCKLLTIHIFDGIENKLEKLNIYQTTKYPFFLLERMRAKVTEPIIKNQ